MAALCAPAGVLQSHRPLKLADGFGDGQFLSGRESLNERLGFLAHELRNLIYTATLAFTAIKAGNVGLAGRPERARRGLRALP